MRQADPLTALRIRLISITCIGLAGAVSFVILYWILSGSLEDIETIFAGIIFVAIVAGIGFLAHKGRPTLSVCLLIALLLLLITADLVGYGVTSPAAAAYIIPILLAAFCLGRWPALGVAGFGTAVGWLVAWIQTSSIYTQPPADISQLTFNAPALTAVLLVSGIMAGLWADEIQKIVSRQ